MKQQDLDLKTTMRKNKEREKKRENAYTNETVKRNIQHGPERISMRRISE